MELTSIRRLVGETADARERGGGSGGAYLRRRGRGSREEQSPRGGADGFALEERGYESKALLIAADLLLREAAHRFEGCSSSSLLPALREELLQRFGGGVPASGGGTPYGRSAEPSHGRLAASYGSFVEPRPEEVGEFLASALFRMTQKRTGSGNASEPGGPSLSPLFDAAFETVRGALRPILSTDEAVEELLEGLRAAMARHLPPDAADRTP